MFEKEAERKAIETCPSNLDMPTYVQGFVIGAEFGYNKANEWHYVKDGDLPKDFGNYVVAFYGAKGSVANGKPCWEELCFDAETLRWVDRDTFEDLPYVNKEGIVIAWKEIVLPKEVEK
jgi:hypothetical protein